MMRAIALAFVAACSSPNTAPPAGDAGGDASTAPAWQVVLSNLDGTLLSMWGTSATNAFAVGGPLGNSPYQTLVVHFDGASWQRLAPGGTETYWWVNGTSADDVWMVGEKGRITHYDGATFVEHTSGTTATLFGVWAASPTDVWAVGGSPTSNGPNDVVLHYDGTSWSPVALPMVLGRTYFKVWGASSADLYVVGADATIWHRSGATWTRAPPLAQGYHFYLNRCSATEIYAVGGRDVLRSDGTTWTALDVTLTNDVNGVACSAPGAVAIVGFGGLKQRLVGGAWHDEATSMPYSDLHGAWADPTGAYWAAGGDFISDPAPNVVRNGTVARYGPGTVPSTLAQ